MTAHGAHATPHLLSARPSPTLPPPQVTAAAVERAWRDGVGALLPQGHNTQAQADALGRVEWVVDYAADTIEAARMLQRAILSAWGGGPSEPGRCRQGS